MNKRITVQAHLSIEQVEARYRKAQDPVERSHWQIIWLVAQDKTTGEITEVTGYCASWIYAIVHRYNYEGSAGLGDRRHGNPGGTFILSAEQQQQLEHDLDAGAPDGGLWTGPKVAHWIFVHTGRQVHPQRGWEYLKRLGYSKRVLRPRHARADPAAPSGFQKNLPVAS
jgi:transposase